MLAGSMLRSAKTWEKLYIQNPDRYFLAIPSKISMEQNAKDTAIDYTIEWEAKPWLYSDKIYTVSGAGTITITRTLADGGWTPTSLLVTGNNVTISGYTATQFAGYISISGAASNFAVTTAPFTATNPRAMNHDYELYLGPETTTIETTGATSVIVIWQNRWYL
jgi:hypothetical protein